MPNPSNSDLVGEALRRIEEADISPDDVFDFADAVSELALQLEQARAEARQSAEFLTACLRDRERYREALERIEAQGTREQQSLGRWGNPGRAWLELNPEAEIARAALTTPDPSTEDFDPEQERELDDLRETNSGR